MPEGYQRTRRVQFLVVQILGYVGWPDDEGGAHCARRALPWQVDETRATKNLTHL
jgi:hypothetical protein